MAYLQDFENLRTSGGSCEVVCIRLMNASMVMRVMDHASYSRLIRQMTDWMKTLVPRYRIYRASPTAFILVSMRPDSGEGERWAQAAFERFGATWPVNGIEVPLKALVLRAVVPREFSTTADVLAMVEGSVPMSAGSHVLAGSDLDFLKRRSQVERAVARGLEQGNFEVYYQPICRMDGTVCAAEALMRLHDPELGAVPPLEFIEVAERSGTIDRIGMFGLKEVCRFLASGQPAAVGVESIHVNLSVLQCLQPDFADKVREMVGRFKASPQQVNFEITESMAADDDGILSGLMQDLAEDGFHFSMDDYGTGFSSAHSVFALDFNIVKIDKSILWDADADSDGRYILESTMQMMHATGHETVVEGVETEEQMKLLRSLGADYIQGYLYSKPLPKEDFLKRVEELNAAR
jgi:EAL domain-containing protein (putative c-di-GMP-specific phosphodiesterase class I)